MRAEEYVTDVGGGNCGNSHRNKGLHAHLLQQQLHGKKHSAYRCVESGGSTAPCPGRNQYDPLVWPHSQNLTDRRAEGGTDLNDRAFTPYGTTAPYRKRRGEGFDDRHYRANGALLIMDRVHDLRNAGSLCFWSEVLDQECNTRCADHWHEDDERSPRAGESMNVCVVHDRQFAQKEQIVEKGYEPAKHHGPKSGYYADQD
jgi:hypothetical protein